MKNLFLIIRSFLLAVPIILTYSCADLDENPKGQLAKDNFFNSENDLDLALNGMYSILSQDMYANNGVGFDAVAGDDITTHPASNKQGIREVDTYNVSDNNTWVDELWRCRWRLIKSCNFIIDNAAKTKNASQEKIDQTLGQAYYWRAYSYFYLVMDWGKLPIITEDAVSFDVPLSSVKDVFDLIVSDLQKAEQMVPVYYDKEPYFQNGVNVAVGQAAVKATLSYVYMSMAGWPLNLGAEYYRKAAEKAKEVIDGVDNGTYHYSLLDNYADVYSYKYNHDNPELLLGIYYNRSVDAFQNSTLCDFLQDMAYGGGWDDTHGEIKFWKDFPDGPRKEATYFPKIILMSEASEKKLRDWWEDPDPNSPRTVVAPCFMKTQEGAERGMEFDYRNPAAINQEGEKTHQVIRLSEVYCWYAEAVGRSGSGDITDAVRVLNLVRNRADGTESNIYSTSMSHEELAEAAYNEHGWEIAGYYWGNIATRARDMFRMYRIKDHFEYRKQNPQIEVAPGVFRNETVPVTGVWDDSKMYLKYPARDADINNNLN